MWFTQRRGAGGGGGGGLRLFQDTTGAFYSGQNLDQAKVTGLVTEIVERKKKTIFMSKKKKKSRW